VDRLNAGAALAEFYVRGTDGHVTKLSFGGQTKNYFGFTVNKVNAATLRMTAPPGAALP
jgi:hypothetical protein